MLRPQRKRRGRRQRNCAPADKIGEGPRLCQLRRLRLRRGHRNDVEGFARGLEAFDARMPEILGALSERDMLFIVADHGCDPTTPSTDHSWEMTPLLVVGPPVRAGVDLGTRTSFSDVAATIAEAFGVSPPPRGQSFLADLITRNRA